MKYRTWNVRSLPRSGSLTTVAKELTRYKLNLVCVQEVRWDKGSTVSAGDYICFHGKRKQKSSVGKRFYLYTTEEYRQLRRYSFLVTGCHV